MLTIKCIECNMLQENCYIISDETQECVICDCGAFYAEEKAAIVAYIRENHLKPVHLIATHGHVDHNFGNKMVFDTYGLQPEVHKADRFLMEKLPIQAKHIIGIEIEGDMPAVGKYLDGTDVIVFGNHRLQVIETPGHSPGSVFYYCPEEHTAFSGDTLFRHSIGRTDFEGGSMFQIIQSLRMLCQWPDQTKVYPGHGPATTIGEELASNPYLDR